MGWLSGIWLGNDGGSIMKLIVGLGNPGRKYQDTRHNVGYNVLAELARRHGPVSPKKKFHGEAAEISYHGDKVLLLSPTTYMNLSGNSVASAREFYRLPLRDILIISDDLNLPLGRIRFREKGSCGGQKGLRHIIQQLGSDSIPRLRIGIGPVPENWDAADFVLGKFSKEERPRIDEIIVQAADAAECWLRSGPTETMNRFNTV